MSSMTGPSSSRSDEVTRVREIMIPLDKYPWVRITDPLSRAVALIRDAHLDVGRHRSLPRVLLVFDHDDELVGIVRRRDIMRGLEPNFLVNQPLDVRVSYFEVGVDPHLAELAEEGSLEKVLKGLRDQAKRPVGDVMRPITTTLYPDDPLMKAVYEMVSLNASLIPVVDEDEVLGVVRSVEVFHELAELMNIEG